LNRRWRLIVSVVGIRRTCRVVWAAPARGNTRIVGTSVGFWSVIWWDGVVSSGRVIQRCWTSSYAERWLINIIYAIPVSVWVFAVWDAVTVGVRVRWVRVIPVRQPVTVDVRVGGIRVFAVRDAVTVTVWCVGTPRVFIFVWDAVTVSVEWSTRTIIEWGR
jgi:hypothetical protein